MRTGLRTTTEAAPLGARGFLVQVSVYTAASVAYESPAKIRVATANYQEFSGFHARPNAVLPIIESASVVPGPDCAPGADATKPLASDSDGGSKLISWARISVGTFFFNGPIRVRLDVTPLSQILRGLFR